MSSAIIRAFALSGVEMGLELVDLFGGISMNLRSVCGVSRLLALDLIGVLVRESVSEWELAMRTSLSLGAASSCQRKNMHCWGCGFAHL